MPPSREALLEECAEGAQRTPLTALDALASARRVCGSTVLGARLWGLVLGLLAAHAVEKSILVYFSFVHKHFISSLQERNADAFYRSMQALICVVIFGIVPIAMIEKFLQGSIGIEWRRSLTNSLLRSYLEPGQAYIKLRHQIDCVDNPDERIGQDVATFAQNSVCIVVNILDSVMTVVSFSSVLASISVKTLVFVLCFSAFATLSPLAVFTMPLTRIQRRLLAQEATLRFDLVHIRENAESISQNGQGHSEVEKTMSVFADVLATSYRQLYIVLGVHGYRMSFRTVIIVLPAMVLGPAYLRGNVEFGSITQFQFVCAHILNSVLVLVEQIEQVSQLGASATRVAELQQVLSADSDV